ncbi:MAG: hypothetical protein A2W17_06220 [Planctomycetes bacterium RBG_16_41_13]|nr:MAG: hypothetical protein A2W17_06220 [Planctomycetes bacterium RBG_16_41_13]
MKTTLEKMIEKWAKEEFTTVSYKRDARNKRTVEVQTPPLGIQSLSRLYKLCNPMSMCIFAGTEYLHGLEIQITE